MFIQFTLPVFRVLMYDGISFEGDVVLPIFLLLKQTQSDFLFVSCVSTEYMQMLVCVSNPFIMIKGAVVKCLECVAMAQKVAGSSHICRAVMYTNNVNYRKCYHDNR